MAGDWIKFRTSLPRHPKVVRMARALGAHVREILGACAIVWSIADEQTENGKLDGYTLADLDNASGLVGFGQAMADVEWASENAEGVVLIEFRNQNGSTAKRRAVDAKRAALKRDRVQRNRSEKRHDATVTKLGPREEKRREEYSSSSSNAENRAAPAAAGLSPETVKSNAEYLRRKPDWLPEGKPWLTHGAVAEFADSWLTADDVSRVLREAKDSRKTLDNPAGWIVKQLRELARQRHAEQAGGAA